MKQFFARPRNRRLVLLAVLIIAAVLIAIGVMQGQPIRVWNKAAMICYECIGLG